MSECSAAMKRLAAGAVGSATQRSYQSAVNSYKAFCLARFPQPFDPSPHALAPTTAGEWVTSIATEGRLTSQTLRVYITGLRAWWRLEGMGGGQHPMDHPALERVIAGACRALDNFRLQRASSSVRLPTAITGSLLLQLEPALRSDGSPFSTMILAAAMLGVHGALRPGEMLGSAAHPNRAPLAAYVVFHAHAHSKVILALQSGSASRVPDRFTIDLGVTKTDQAGRKAPRACAVPVAVRAMWEWMLLRGHLLTNRESALLFYVDGKQLLMPTLLHELEKLHELQGLGPVRFTGKSFRRGGTSEAAAAGMPIADLQARAGWASSAMPSVYTTAEAAEERRLTLDRLVPSHL